MKIGWDADIKRSVRQQQAVGKFIHGLASWTWWGTLTFRYDVVEEQANKLFKSWLRILARFVAQRHVPVAWALERGKEGRLHFHVLLALPPKFSSTEIRLIEGHWKRLDVKNGHTQFKQYDEDSGAAWYMSKTNGWEFNVACSRGRKCRKGHCVAAPSPL